MRAVWVSAVLLAVMGGLLPACDNSSTEEQTFQRPLPNALPEAHSLEIDAAEGGEVTLPSGTRIIVPKMAFVDKSGNPISNGKVQLAYREYLDAASIIASGIPMTYDSGGVRHHFESAGMFELYGYKKGVTQAQIVPTGGNNAEPVAIAEGKTIQVDMGSNVPGTRFNTYYYNPEASNWEMIGKEAPVPNEEKAKKLDEEAPMPNKPGEPILREKGMNLFELEVDYEYFEEFKGFEDVLWQYDEQDKSIINQTWDDVELNYGAEGYEMKLSRSGGSEVAKIKVKPTFDKQNYDKAVKKFQKRMKKYEKQLKNRRIAEKRRAGEADLRRRVSAQGFGAYNSDVIYAPQGNLLTINAKINLPGGNEVFSRGQLFHLTGRRGTAVLTHDVGNDGLCELRINDSMPNTLIVFLGKDKFGYVESSELIGKAKTSGGELVLDLKVKENIKSVQELVEVFGA